jgi:hypothetical protein
MLNRECVWVTGGGTSPTHLQKVEITKITNTECSSRWSGVSGATINSGHICFFTGSGISACNVRFNSLADIRKRGDTLTHIIRCLCFYYLASGHLASRIA